MSASQRPTAGAPRPPFIRHHTELPAEVGRYPGDDEAMSEGRALSRPLGLVRLGVHHETLPPGTRTSWPHAEEQEEELVYVLEGTPDAWIDGVLHRLAPGDVAVFPPGTGVAHSFLNNGDAVVRLLVVGERVAGNRILYPLQPEGWAGMAPELRWTDAPPRVRGSHDGLPDSPRARRIDARQP